MSDALYDHETCPHCGGDAVKNKTPNPGPANGFDCRCMTCGTLFTTHPVLPETGGVSYRLAESDAAFNKWMRDQHNNITASLLKASEFCQQIGVLINSFENFFCEFDADFDFCLPNIVELLRLDMGRIVS